MKKPTNPHTLTLTYTYTIALSQIELHETTFCLEKNFLQATQLRFCKGFCPYIFQRKNFKKFNSNLI